MFACINICIHTRIRILEDGLKACATEALHSNAAAADALYIEFKPATSNSAYLYIHVQCYFFLNFNPV